MTRTVLFAYTWPVAILSGLLAAACVASAVYLGWFQSELILSLRADSARLHTAQQAQIHLREYRVHTIVLAASPTEARRKQADADRERVVAALAELEHFATTDDQADLNELTEGWRRYEEGLRVDDGKPAERSPEALVEWADAHRVRELLVPCGRLVERYRERMAASAARSAEHTRWAGAALLGIGVVGPLAGLIGGYGIARGLARRFQEHQRVLHRAEQLAAVGQLAAGIAHEVRNPLTGIKMLVEAAVRPVAPTPLATADLELVRDEISRLERLVQELLDYAKPSPLARRRQDVRPTVARAAEVVAAHAAAAGVSVQVTTDVYPLFAAVDPDRFMSLLTNLLHNALDATPRGGRVVVDTARSPDGLIRVRVTDTGPGLPAELADTLFTPFATTKAGGTGLGLAVARRVAEDHGGTLVAESVVGGARFTLIIPPTEVARAETTGG